MIHMRKLNIIIRSLVVWGMLLAALSLPLQSARAQDVQSYDLTFEQMGYEERIMRDPFGVVRYYFSLPANWQVEAGSYVELHLNYWLGKNTLVPNSTLTVRFNNETLQVQSLENQGEITFQFDLPPESFYAPDSGLLNVLELQLEAFVDCVEFADAQVLLAVRKTSFVHLAYSTIPLVLDLSRFPKPIYYERAFLPEQASFVLPDGATANDMETALSIASRLGAVTGSQLQLNAMQAGGVNQTTAADTHLLIIGKPDTNPLIGQLELPVPAKERLLAVRSEMPAVLVPGQAFNVTVTVKNTSDAARSVKVLDLLAPGVSVSKCAQSCNPLETGGVEWNIGNLDPGQEASNQFEMLLSPDVFQASGTFQHTVSLLDDQGQVINVDSLSADINPAASADETAQTVSSPDQKGAYFFVQDGQAVAEGDGLIQEVVSPWNPGKAVVVVTGLTDAALLKAGHALGTTTQFPGMSGTSALIESTLPYTPTTTAPEDITFASLGYSDAKILLLEGGSVEGAGGLQVKFNIPNGWLLGDDTALALHFGFGEGLKTINGTLEVGLNGMPVNSILLSEETSSASWSSLALPKNSLQVGTNVLTFALLGDLPKCINFSLAQSYWLTIFSDSYLHLPHDTAQGTFDLRNYPYPFIEKGDLSDVVFALPEKVSPAEFTDILHLASNLGYASDGNHFSPRVTLGGNPQGAPWQGFHMIAYGRPTQNAYIAAANTDLPQPFIPGTDEIVQQVDNVVYRLPAGYDLGYIQLLVQPWSSTNAMLIITGSTDKATTWAVNGMLNPLLNYKLKGNLALMVSESDLRATDTREPQTGENIYSNLFPVTAAQPTPAPLLPTATPIPAQPQLQLAPEAYPMPTPTSLVSNAPVKLPPQQNTYLWLLLVASGVVVAVVIGLAFWRRG